MKPSECQVCGGREWMMLTTTKTVNLGDEPMAIDKDLLSSFKFRSTIQNFCQTVGWNLYSIDDTIAILRFNMDSGSTQTVFIIKYDSTLEFSCPSSLKLDDIDDIPHRLSTLLLKKNAGYKFGFWSIKEIANKQIFSIIHNAEMSLIDINYFCKIVDRLIQECDEFEQAIANIMNS
ncbi:MULTISPECIES: hypothetical protein [unclassified Dolichospermum]|nr:MULTISPECIES: hypothetical protein [unclassified Dolichospermum]